MNYSKLLFTAIFILGVASVSYAQPRLSSSNSAPGGAPIDGGISLLVAGIAGYGIKKIRDNHKKVKAQTDI